MAASLTSTVGQFSIVDGAVQEDAPNLMVTRGPLEPQSRDAGQLCIAVELVGRSLGEEQMYTELLQAVSDAYFRYRGSITERLQEAIQEANALLVHANTELPPSDRLIGGITCVFHMDRDIYIGQAGPAAVYVAQKGAMQRFPESSPWLQRPLPGAPERLYPAPLGIHPTVHPNLFHATVQPGDVIVLGTTALAMAASTRDVGEAVVFQAVEDALYNMARLCGDAEVSCMVVVIHAKGQPIASAPAAASLRAEEPSPAAEVSPEPALPEPEKGAGEDEGPIPGWEPIPEPPTFRPADEAEGAFPLEPLEEPVAAAYAEPLERAARPSRAPRGGMSLLGIGRAIGAGVREFFTALGLGFAVIGGWFASLFRSEPRRVATSPTHAAGARPARRPRQSIVRRPWFWIAIAIPIIAGIVVGVLFVQSKQRQQKYEDLLQQSQDKTAQVQSVPGVSDKQALLAEALALADEARKINAADPRTAQLAAQIQATLDQVEGTVRLDAPIILYQAAASEDAQWKRLVIAGADVYLLDAKNHRVVRKTLDDGGIRLQPDQAAPVILDRGRDVGGYAVTALWDAAWAVATGNRQSSGLLVLTEDRRLVEFNPRRGLSLLPLDGADRWQQPAAVASYSGNLYVVDAAANQILRYSATASGYDNPPDDWFSLSQARDLRGAVDIAIDGAVYVLYGTGRLEKFLRGEKQPFSLEGLAQPLQQTVALYADVDEEAKHVYVADPGAQRIVQFAKDGKFVRQFRFRQGDFLGRVADLRVDEANARLYFVAGDALYVCALPR
jgi:hypothetical protein